MIRFQITIDSTILLRPVDIIVVAPYGFTAGSQKRLPMVLALHCALKDGDFFFNGLGATSMVESDNLAIIAPSLGNHYFTNTPANHQLDFLRFELIPAMRNFLPLSTCQTDNAVLGISMGAFGAMCLMLQCPGLFGSGALISGFYNLRLDLDKRIRKDRRLMTLYTVTSDMIKANLYEQPDKIRPEADLEYLWQQVVPNEMGRMDIYCGDRDYLCLNQSENFYSMCIENNLHASLNISPGSHDEVFWKNILPVAINGLFAKETLKIEA